MVTGVEVANLVVASFGLLATVVGALIAILTLRRGNLNASAALVHGMQVAFMEAFDSYLTESDEARHGLKISNIMTLVEVAAATHCDRTLTGRSGNVMEEYLRDILEMIADREDLVAAVAEMRHQPSVLVFMDQFIDAMDKKGLARPFTVLRTPRAECRSGFQYERRGGSLRSAWFNFQKCDFPGVISLIMHPARYRQES